LRLVSQIRQPRSDGRAYFDRKVTEGRTKKEAVYRQMLSDADRTTP
jgi:hypothetical protein